MGRHRVRIRIRAQTGGDGHESETDDTTQILCQGERKKTGFHNFSKLNLGPEFSRRKKATC